MTGRPRMGEAPLCVVVGIRLTSDEAERFRADAAAEGQRLSGYLRDLIILGAQAVARSPWTTKQDMTNR